MFCSVTFWPIGLCQVRIFLSPSNHLLSDMEQITDKRFAEVMNRRRKNTHNNAESLAMENNLRELVKRETNT